jgi:hypothetical protein
MLKWDTIIQEKTVELARYLAGRSRRLDFTDPAPVLESIDNRAIREIILNLTRDEARKRGIGKSTLHYLRKRAAGESAFTISRKVANKLKRAPVVP